MDHEAATTTVVQEAFAGRAVCFVTDDPPLAWGDLQLSELGLTVTQRQHGSLTFSSASMEQASHECLVTVATSTDFRHYALWIVAPSSPESCQNFVETLAHAHRHLGHTEAYVKGTSQEIAALWQQVEREKTDSAIEFVECDQDGDNLYWYNPEPTRLARVIEALRTLSDGRGWRFEINSYQGA